MEEIEKNPVLDEVVNTMSPLTELIVNYVGNKLDPEEENITVEMIVHVFADEFPEFLIAIAEENFIRGYHQAFADIEEHEKALVTEEEPEKTSEDV